MKKHGRMKRLAPIIAGPAIILAAIPLLLHPSSQITVTIGGDVMFDRHVREIAEKNGYDSLFAGIAPMFHRSDISVVNLEGPITSNPSKTLLPNGKTTKDLSFTFAPETAGTIAAAGITAVSLANNHTDNFGRKGIDETKQSLQKAGVDWFGDPSNISGTELIECVPKELVALNRFCVALVGYDEFQSGLDVILADITRLTGKGYPVIVMAHWGDEYSTTAVPRVKEKARQLAQAGAIAIIGSHPHVVEQGEWIGNVPVIYSLGNLVFDQYFSAEVMSGEIAEITLTKEKDAVSVGKIMLYKVSNRSKTGPQIVGEPIEFSR